MDQSQDVTNVKSESTKSTSSCSLGIFNDKPLKTIKQEDNSFVLTKICIKTESEKDDSKFSTIPGISYEMCSNYGSKVGKGESTIKLQCDNSKEEIIKVPLDINGIIKGNGNVPINLDVSESRIKIEPSEEHIFFGRHFLDQVADERTNEHLPFGPNDDTKFKMKNIKEKEDCLSTSNEQSVTLENIDSDNSQLLEGNKEIGEDNKNSCHICCKIFTWKCQLEKHLRIHTGERPFICHICKKSFNIKGSLDRHMFIHGDEKPHACNVCEKVFRDRSSLRKHLLIHSDLKPFSCTDCNKSFREKNHLVRHQRIHTGDRPYSCNFCEKSFSDQSTLIRHKRIHTGEKPYSCDLCNKSYPQKSHLNQHKKHHKS